MVNTNPSVSAALAGPAGPELSSLVDAAWVGFHTRRSLSSIWRDNTTGRLPQPVRVGRAMRWRRDEILRWIDAGCPSRKDWEAKEGRS